MDFNEYYIECIVKRHLADLRAEAQRDRLRRLAFRPRPLRTTLGAAFIRLGAWLLREEYVSRSAS